MRYVAVSVVTDRETHRMITVNLAHAPRVNNYITSPNQPKNLANLYIYEEIMTKIDDELNL